MVSSYAGSQVAAPERMHGRMMGLVFVLVMQAQLGALFVGMLADALGDRLALGLFGAVPAVVLGWLLGRGFDDLRSL